MAIEQIVIDRMNELAPLNYDICGEIAKEFGLKQRSIVASATRNKIAYENKPRVSKSGKAVASKSDLVSAIAENMDLTVAALDGLEKATKTALTNMVEKFEEVAFDEAFED
jgi:hypothetical protein